MRVNDRVTPETAKRLRDAGFPQPTPAPGQVWYDQNDSAFVIRSANKDGIWLCGFQSEFDPYGNLVYTSLKNWKGVTYAATAPDILLMLGDEWSLENSSGAFRCRSRGPQLLPKLFANPAEATALAWFEQNQP